MTHKGNKKRVSAKEQARRQAQSRQAWRAKNPDKAAFQDAMRDAQFHRAICSGCPRCTPRLPYGFDRYGDWR